MLLKIQCISYSFVSGYIFKDEHILLSRVIFLKKYHILLSWVILSKIQCRSYSFVSGYIFKDISYSFVLGYTFKDVS